MRLVLLYKCMNYTLDKPIGTDHYSHYLHLLIVLPFIVYSMMIIIIIIIIFSYSLLALYASLGDCD